jgi:hypothetical protein
MRTQYRIVSGETRECSRGILYNHVRGVDMHVLETTGWFTKTVWYTAQIDPETPSVWYDKRLKLFVMADRHTAKTDMGSTKVQSLFPPTEAVYAYYPHDSAYAEHGLWVCETLNGEVATKEQSRTLPHEDLEGTWRFQKMDRATVDEMCLSAMLEAGGMSRCRRGIVWGVVMAVGWYRWNQTTKRHGGAT